MRRFVITSALVLASFGCSTPEPPTNPSWDVDVYPLLRGSCLSCHGEVTTSSGVNIVQQIYRLDICDRDALGDLKTVVSDTTGAAFHAGLMNDSTKAAKSKRMPPPPAAPLSDYDRKLLANWAARVAKSNPADACKKSTRNNKPTAVLVSKKLENGKVTGILDISDPDGDQVVGKATVGGGSQDFASSGRRELMIQNATGNKLQLKLSDSYETVEITFDL